MVADRVAAGDAEPTKYWLSTLPVSLSFPELVRLAKLRWRIERDYQELKDELGLDHFGGRGWRGFPHHWRVMHRGVCLPRRRAREAFPPEPLVFLRTAPLPKGFTPRGDPGPA